jgi:hypothetical protein
MGASGLLLASSIEPPTMPVAAVSRMVSAAISGESPKPFSRSALTGRSVADARSAALAKVCSRVIVLSRWPMEKA